ncbi:MAG: ComEC/Rec2 family competence protein [Cohaesibacteraceae bacterium]
MLDIRIWDVGAALSIRIKTPNGQNHFIDAGRSSSFSPAEHIYQSDWGPSDCVDYLVISHPDSDHIGDLPNLVHYLKRPLVLRRNKSVPDEHKWGSLSSDYQKVFKDLDTTYSRTIDPVDDPTLPENNGGVTIEGRQLDWKEAGSSNNSSIVMAYRYGPTSVMFPGDIEADGWARLRQKHERPCAGAIDGSETRILVAPHHGRSSAYSEDMIEYFNPDLIVVSDGHGRGETDRRFQTKARGLYRGDELLKFVSTERGGRKRILIGADGSLRMDEWKPSNWL